MKRLAALLLILGMLAGSAFAESIDMDGRVMQVDDGETYHYEVLTDENGNPLTPEFTYLQIRALFNFQEIFNHPQVYSAEAYDPEAMYDPWALGNPHRRPLLALMDAGGNLLTDFEFVDLDYDIEAGKVTGFRSDGTTVELDTQGYPYVYGGEETVVGILDLTKPFVVTVTDEETYTYDLLMLPDGTMLTERRACAGIERLVDGLYAAESFVEGVYDPWSFGMVDGRNPMALMREDGTLLTEYLYKWLTAYEDDGVIVATRSDNMYCALDFEGRVLMDGFDLLLPNGEGGWLASVLDTTEENNYRNGPLVYIDAEGNRRDTGFRVGNWGETCHPFSEGLARLEQENATVFLRPDGTEAFRLEGVRCTDFLNGVAVVTAGALQGLVGTDGGMLLPAEYPIVTQHRSLGENALVLAVNTAGLLEIYSSDGRTLIATVGDPSMPISHVIQQSVDYILVHTGTARILVRRDGTVVHGSDLSWGAEYVSVDSGYSPDKQSDRLILKKGQYPYFTHTLTDLSLNPVSGEYQDISRRGKDEYGVEVFELSTYSLMTGNDGQVKWDYSSRRFGLMDANGNVLIEPVYEMITQAAPGRFWVKQEGVYLLIDTAGDPYIIFVP